MPARAAQKSFLTSTPRDFPWLGEHASTKHGRLVFELAPTSFFQEKRRFRALDKVYTLIGFFRVQNRKKRKTSQSGRLLGRRKESTRSAKTKRTEIASSPNAENSDTEKVLTQSGKSMPPGTRRAHTLIAPLFQQCSAQKEDCPAGIGG